MAAMGGGRPRDFKPGEGTPRKFSFAAGGKLRLRRSGGARAEGQGKRLPVPPFQGLSTRKTAQPPRAATPGGRHQPSRCSISGAQGGTPQADPPSLGGGGPVSTRRKICPANHPPRLQVPSSLTRPAATAKSQNVRSRSVFGRGGGWRHRRAWQAARANVYSLLGEDAERLSTQTQPHLLLGNAVFLRER